MFAFASPVDRTSRRPLGAARPLRGFTLTELLIVIAIIAVLASLITAAAVNALRAARRGRIVMQINQMATSLENFQKNLGEYPPNAINPIPNPSAPPGTPAALVQADMERMFKRAFPRHREPRQLILALCGQNSSNPNLLNGMNAAEGLYFWLGGFSADEQFPISGPGGPSFPTSGPNANIEVLEERAPRAMFQFDLGNLGPREDDVFSGRFIEYQVDLNGDGNATGPGESRQINFWQYVPSGSEQPIIYLDTSRHKPYQYDPPARAPQSGAPSVYALKKVREGFPNSQTPRIGDLTFIDRKFQILHCGLDDDWGDFGQSATTNTPTANVGNQAVFPDGPFIGPIADTLTNFTEGELADAAEEQ